MRLLLLLLAIILPAHAQSAADLEKLELDLAQMLIHADWDHYGARLADDYLRINMNGTEQNKQQTLTYLTSGPSKILDLAPEKMNVRFYGETAIVNGDLTTVQRVNGKVITTLARFTETFARRDGQWFLTTSHFTMAPR
ncbi:MAG TPA: nuclear transport factor 2 family protein [Terriglobales bacterium]|nr:nuclear transport factor 2 family protein [Terriglobales bacterium]